jgi:hypothetical protein
MSIKPADERQKGHTTTQPNEKSMSSRISPRFPLSIMLDKFKSLRKAEDIVTLPDDFKNFSSQFDPVLDRDYHIQMINLGVSYSIRCSESFEPIPWMRMHDIFDAMKNYDVLKDLESDIPVTFVYTDKKENKKENKKRTLKKQTTRDELCVSMSDPMMGNNSNGSEIKFTIFTNQVSSSIFMQTYQKNEFDDESFDKVRIGFGSMSSEYSNLVCSFAIDVIKFLFITFNSRDVHIEAIKKSVFSINNVTVYLTKIVHTFTGRVFKTEDELINEFQYNVTNGSTDPTKIRFYHSGVVTENNNKMKVTLSTYADMSNNVDTLYKLELSEVKNGYIMTMDIVHKNDTLPSFAYKIIEILDLVDTFFFKQP